MALHLITGYIGTEHVTADNAGHFNAQLVGEDSFVFGSGKKFEFNINSNNEIRVYDGQGCVNGRHFEMPSGTYEDLSISNGVQNMARNDLIVARYSIDSDTGIESISLAVIEGEPSSSTPSDPAYNGGSVLENAPTVDFPLYRVKIVGLSIESVDTLFSTKVNLQKQISTLDTKVSELNLKMDKLSSHVGMIIQTTTLDTEAKVKAIYGGISWIKIEGKMLLGQSSNYAINKTGGSATNTLSVANLPSHAHGLNNHTHSYNHTHGTNATGGHVHTVQWRQTINEDGTHNRWYMCPAPDKTSAQGIGSAGEHTHITTSQSTTTTGTASGNTTRTGNGTAINNMPPYKVVYIWERTA